MILIEFQDQNGRWHRFQQLHNPQDAFRVASRRAQSTGKRHRIIDENQNLIDIIEPWQTQENKEQYLILKLHMQ
jgi:hypothetical protein